MRRTYVFERLRELPDVFDLPTLCRTSDIKVESARVWLSRWSAKGMVRSAGPKAGVYYNLVVGPEVSEAMRLKALRIAYPSAVLVGETVLNRAGWSTQVPQAISVAVPRRPYYAQVDGFSIHGRPTSWYRLVQGRLERDTGTELGAPGLPSLVPADALADAFLDPDGWHPDPDDLYLDDSDLGTVRDAFRHLGVPIPERLAELLEVEPKPTFA